MVACAVATGLLAQVTGARAQAWTWSEVSIPTRDTNALAADLWSGDAAPAARPVVLIQTPYNRKLYRIGQVPGFGGPDFPRSTNFNVVVVDWRGFYGSTNAAKPGYNRGWDGYDCVQWIATQAWCNGRVGTWGSSALGYIQYQTAAQHPPNLVSCVIQVKDFQNRYDNNYYGGVYRKEHVESVASLGLASTNLVLDHPTYDTYWQLVEALSDHPETIAVPVLVVGGWYDHFPDSVLRSFRDLRDRSDPSVRGAHRLVFGPWLHDATGLAEQGALSYPNATNLDADTIAYWDFTLRQATNVWSTSAVARVYQMGEDVWLDAASWTGLPRSARSLYLQDGGGLGDAPAAAAATNAFVYDPADPTPALGGSRFNPFDPLVLEGPQDLAPAIESRGDVLVYSTPPLERALRLNGAISIVLHVSSDRTDTDFAVRLSDVYPDGRSLVMTQGIRRGRFRDSLATPSLMVPGVVYPVTIELQQLGLTFQPGHRLRLVVSSACYPHFDLNRNDGGAMYTNGPLLVATNRVHLGPSEPSRMDFAVLPDDLDSDGLYDVWEAQHFRGLGRDGAGDEDGDGMADRAEQWAGTAPTNAASLLRIAGLDLRDSGAMELRWTSESGRTYDVMGGADPALGAWTVLTNVSARPPTNEWAVQGEAAVGALGVRARRVGDP